jgi:asparagine synthase (glutamine-hydrolysing)
MPSAASLALWASTATLGRSITGSALRLVTGRDPAPVMAPLAQRLRDDSVNYLANLLHYADRTAMFHSVESRAPFMDYRVHEFVHALPVSYRIHDGWRKWIARAAFDGKLPGEIVWRRGKLGWPIPERAWFEGPLRDQVAAERLSLRLRPIADLLRSRHRALGLGGSISGRVRMLVLATWYERFFGSA